MGGRRTKLSRDLMVMFKTIAFLQILLEYTHHSASKCDYAFSKFCIKNTLQRQLIKIKVSVVTLIPFYIDLCCLNTYILSNS